MSFKENFLKKIRIDDLAKRAIRSWGPPGSERRLDLDILRELLGMSDYQHLRERELDLYIKPDNGEKSHILVLDNELKVYHTTVGDAVMRKNPTVKEMVSIRNAIKILNDKDVAVSRKADTVLNLQSELIAALDLSYSATDLADLVKDGADSLKNAYAEGIQEALLIFSELLGYGPPPKALEISHHDIFCKKTEKGPGKTCGPLVLYNRMNNTLKLVETTIDPDRKPDMEKLQEIVKGEKDPDVSGAAVFDFLKSRVPPPTGGV